VISWGDAHIRAGALAAQMHADLDIPMDRPIDVFGAIEQLGLILAFSDLGSTSGAYLPTNNLNGILLHSRHPRTRQRYTASHELGHHAFAHAADVDADLEGALRRDDLNRWPDHEKEAEAFGAWFLMPRRVLLAGLKELGLAEIRSAFDVYALSLWLGTSYTATARQLGTARLVSSNQSRTWARVAPRSIKARLAGRHVPNDLRNDVWWVNLTATWRRLDTRPGDRVVVTATENPSSGYSWRVNDLPPGVRLVADSFTERLDGEQPGDDGNSEVVGGASPHTFVLEIAADAALSSAAVELVLDRRWSQNPPESRDELTIAISPPRRGLQMPEEAFRISQ
jgi:Zn-dependent peptidase ImmA (M78 family)